MTNIKDLIVKKIQEKEIQPKKRILFLGKKIGIWFLVGLSIFLGSISFSVILFSLANRIELGPGFGTLFMLWLISILVLVWLSQVFMRQTEKGYRYQWWTLVVASVGVSILFGSIFFAVKIGSFVDRQISQTIPKYPGVQGNIEARWQDPDDGLIAGDIISVKQNVVVLRDMKKHDWSVDIQKISPAEKEIITYSNSLRVIGFAQDENNFTACAVLPWFDIQGTVPESSEYEIEELFEKEGIYLEIFDSQRPLPLSREIVIPSERNIMQLRSIVCRD